MYLPRMKLIFSFQLLAARIHVVYIWCNILFQTNLVLEVSQGFHLRLVLGCVNVTPGLPPGCSAGKVEAGKEENSWNQAAKSALEKHAEQSRQQR